MTGDIWIEVAEVPKDAGPFVRAISVPVPGRDMVAQMKLQLNLTAYVRHVVEQVKIEPKA